MDIINNNPYRLLGVYANSPVKERVGNEGKLLGFSSKGQIAHHLSGFAEVPGQAFWRRA